MTFKLSRVLTLSGALAIAGAGNTAFAQFGFFNQCCCPCPPPVAVQPCYQTIPVTEYRPVKQVVQRPVVETKYVDQQVTEYRQVMENKTAEIPTCSYQNVTEMHTIQRDCGRWMTEYKCRPKMAPCQYDSRPDLFGFLNRTGYQMRMAFTPDVYAERHYVPNVVAQQIPVTRQVAVRGTQTVNYQVARMVPVTTTRKVAVNSVRMVAQEITTQQAVTVMKTVPVGSAYAWGTPIGAPATATALQPIPDSGATVIRPKTDTKIATPPATDRSAKLPNALSPDADTFDSRESDASDSIIPRKSSSSGTKKTTYSPAPTEEEHAEAPAASDREVAVVTVRAEKPVSSERPIGRWVARKKKPTEGPALVDGSVTVAKADKVRK